MAPAASGAPVPPDLDAAATASGGGRLGLTSATALVVGSIVGVGIFNLPTSLSSYGPISLISMGLTTIGALALALLFAALSRRLPAHGGPYAYARVAFGNRMGFLNAWSYWITAWAGNAAIAVGWGLYVEVFINKGEAKLWSIVLVLVGLWVPAVINLSGIRNMGVVQLATTILKFAALAFMAVVGALVFAFPEDLMRWLLPKDEAKVELLKDAAVAVAIPSLRFCGVLAPIAAAALVLTQALYGAGESRFVAVAELTLHFFCLVPVAFVFAVVLNMGLIGCWYATAIYGLLLLLATAWRFNSGHWKRTVL